MRKEKVQDTIQREVSDIIRNELKDPRLGFVTITSVEVTDDLRNAKIYFSVLGKEEDYKKTEEALKSSLGFIRTQLAGRIQLRFAPEIMFRADKSSVYSARIDQVLDEIKELDKKRKEGTCALRQQLRSSATTAVS
jgi:ribosome-binding factor A